MACRKQPPGAHSRGVRRRRPRQPVDEEPVEDAEAPLPIRVIEELFAEHRDARAGHVADGDHTVRKRRHVDVEEEMRAQRREVHLDARRLALKHRDHGTIVQPRHERTMLDRVRRAVAVIEHAQHRPQANDEDDGIVGDLQAA
jgi:hypothetical protein